MQNTNCKKIPVIIVSGFLGSGKTTFIQKLVAPSLNRERTVILENEFGDVNFDGALLKKRGLSVVSVLAGCICCTGIGNFTGAIQEAAEQFSPQLLVIEPTGVAKLSDILMQFRLPPLSGMCDVRQTITVVDTKNFKDLHFLTEDFYENQLISSDVAVMSKTEGLEQNMIDDVTRQVHEIAPHLLILDHPWEELSEVERETFLQYRKPKDCGCHHCGQADHDDHDHKRDHDGHGHDHDHEHDHDGHGHDHDHEHDHDGHGHDHDEHGHEHHDHEHDHHDHSHAFVAYSFIPGCDDQYLEQNAQALSDDRFGVVLRVKGFLQSSGGTLMQVDYVRGELRITEALGEVQEEGHRLVFIGAGLKEQAIAKFLKVK